MATIGDPRYGVAISMRSPDGDNLTKTFNYVNLKIGSSASGYEVNQIYDIASKIASLAGAEYRSSAIVAQFNIEED